MREGDAVTITNSGSIDTSTLELVDKCLIMIGSHGGPAAVTAKVRVSRDSAKKIELFSAFAARKFGSYKNFHYLFPKEKILEECGVAMAASQKNPNKFGFSFDLINFLTLRNENLFSFPSLNRNFALSLHQ